MSSFWLILKQQWRIEISSSLFSMFNLAAILVGSRDHQTQFWKGAIQGPFHQRLFQIGPVASEELIKMWKFNGWTTDDGRSVVTIAHLILWVRWAKKENHVKQTNVGHVDFEWDNTKWRHSYSKSDLKGYCYSYHFLNVLVCLEQTYIGGN